MRVLESLRNLHHYWHHAFPYRSSSCEQNAQELDLPKKQTSIGVLRTFNLVYCGV